MNTSNTTANLTALRGTLEATSSNLRAVTERLRTPRTEAYERRNKRTLNLETAAQIRGRIEELVFNRDNLTSERLAYLWDNVKHDMVTIVTPNVANPTVASIFEPFMSFSLREEVRIDSRRTAVMKPLVNQLTGAILEQKWEVAEALLTHSEQIAKQTRLSNGSIVIETSDKNGQMVRTIVAAKELKPRRSSSQFNHSTKPRADRQIIAGELAEIDL